MKKITLEMAKKMLTAARKYVQEIINMPSSIAVVDRGGDYEGPHGAHAQVGLGLNVFLSFRLPARDEDI